MADFIKNIERDWTIFLDRDGVINQRPLGDYVKQWNDFIFLPGVKESLSLFNKIFKRTIVVTNQRGVGKGLMTIDDLDEIHNKMIAEMSKDGGHIDAIYYCTDLATKTLNCRKPKTFMAQQALAEFPDIQLEKSIMLGDTETDMEFGRNAGMKTIYINSNQQNINKNLYDACFDSLIDFAKLLISND